MLRVKLVDIFALATAIAISTGYFHYYKGYKESVPATDFYVIRSISIADYVEGQEPLVVFNNEVKQPFAGDWTVDVSNVDDKLNFPPLPCKGSGTKSFTISDSVPPDGVPLTVILAKKCDLKAGQYILKYHLDLRPPNYPTKSLDVASNIFRILPAGSQLYVTPEQSKALEKLNDVPTK